MQRRNLEWQAALGIVLIGVCCIDDSAQALPSFAEQTGQPCAACHVGAFGPQLLPYGRSFKLNGYVAGDGRTHKLPIAASAYASFTHTAKDQSGGAARWFAANDNLAVDQVSLYYAGAITRHIGAFVQTTYDGVARQYHIDNSDIRYAHERDLFGIDTVTGLTLNNNPTVQDLWNSAPAWGFPYNRSRLSPLPIAAARIDGSFGQNVLGLGAYVMWNDWVYTEVDLYRGLERGVLNATGIVPASSVDTMTGTSPYWRLAVQHDLRRYSWEIGTYGIAANVLPAGAAASERPDQFVDAALDANLQLFSAARKLDDDVLSTHATVIDESEDFGGAGGRPGSVSHGHLTTMRIDASYSIAATVTPSAQLFRTDGNSNPGYWQTSDGRPNSSGSIFEIAYAPFGKTGSSIAWGNVRVAAQYVVFTRFDGQAQRASDNDTLYVNVWAAWHF